MLFDFGLDSAFLSDIVVILLYGLLHGEYFSLFSLQFFEEDPQGRFLERFFEFCLFLCVLLRGEDGREGGVIAVVIL